MKRVLSYCLTISMIVNTYLFATNVHASYNRGWPITYSSKLYGITVSDDTVYIHYSTSRNAFKITKDPTTNRIPAEVVQCIDWLVLKKNNLLKEKVYVGITYDHYNQENDLFTNNTYKVYEAIDFSCRLIKI
jgi:hypothetical protein